MIEQLLIEWRDARQAIFDAAESDIRIDPSSAKRFQRLANAEQALMQEAKKLVEPAGFKPASSA